MQLVWFMDMSELANKAIAGLVRICGITQRTNEGRIEARSKNVKFGRKRSIDREKIISLYTSGMGASQIAKQTRIGRSTVYKLIHEA
jgi:DNA invertase Pin-like site-specific DNA recombinase